MRLSFTSLWNQGNKPFKDNWVVNSAGVYTYPTGCLRAFYSHTCLTNIVFPLTWDILNRLGFCSCACWLESRPMVKSLDFSRNNPGVPTYNSPWRT